MPYPEWEPLVDAEVRVRFAIVDDLLDHRELLENAIGRYCAAKSIDVICEQFDSPESCMAAYESGRFDVAFLDGYFDGSRGEPRHQPGSDDDSGAKGIDLARWLRAHGYFGPLIFSTYSTDFAVAGYQVNAAAYMVKPYGQAEVDVVLDKVIRSSAYRQTVTAQHIIGRPDRT